MEVFSWKFCISKFDIVTLYCAKSRLWLKDVALVESCPYWSNFSKSLVSRPAKIRLVANSVKITETTSRMIKMPSKHIYWKKQTSTISLSHFQVFTSWKIFSYRNFTTVPITKQIRDIYFSNGPSKLVIQICQKFIILRLGLSVMTFFKLVYSQTISIAKVVRTISDWFLTDHQCICGVQQKLSITSKHS